VVTKSLNRDILPMQGMYMDLNLLLGGIQELQNRQFGQLGGTEENREHARLKDASQAPPASTSRQLLARRPKTDNPDWTAPSKTIFAKDDGFALNHFFAPELTVIYETLEHVQSQPELYQGAGTKLLGNVNGCGT
jgi:hypothetical protein